MYICQRVCHSVYIPYIPYVSTNRTLKKVIQLDPFVTGFRQNWLVGRMRLPTCRSPDFFGDFQLGHNFQNLLEFPFLGNWTYDHIFFWFSIENVLFCGAPLSERPKQSFQPILDLERRGIASFQTMLPTNYPLRNSWLDDLKLLK